MLENGEGTEEDGAAAKADDDDDDDDKEEPAAKAKAKEAEEEDAAQGTIDKAKNWSAVNVAYRESKLQFRGVLSPMAFTNWMWYRCVRPKLEETKAKLPEIDISSGAYNIDDVEEIMGEFMPVIKEKDKKDKKDDKKDKKDDKKD